MTKQLEVTVPDIGDFEEVDVIDILVAVGDTVAVEDPLVTLESEKATMDIPAPRAGKVAAIRVAVGDKISEGGVIVVIETAEDDASETPESRGSGRQEPGTAEAEPAVAAEATPPAATEPETAATAPSPGSAAGAETVSVTVPDIGDFEDVEVIDILVKTGDSVDLDDPLITLESEKATMDIPAPSAGTVKDIRVAIGDRVSEGHEIVTLTGAAAPAKRNDDTHAGQTSPQTPADPPAARAEPDASAPRPATPVQAETPTRKDATPAYASPSVRKFARELGVELHQVTGSGRKGRITKPDVKTHVKTRLAAGNQGGGLSVAPMPTIDFAKFGPVETLELSKIRRLTGENLHRSWVLAPHVTQFDEADITDLEAFRQAKRDDAAEQGVKLTPVAFLIKAVVVALKKFPDFNASLSADGKSIIRKQYFHIGVAVNTDHGLVVPVIRDADQKGLYQLASELRELSVKAREKKLAPADMQGGCFTITSLGGVGGTMFTPIINVPEVAILGVSPSRMKPVYNDGEFVPRLMLPLALSYDHRVIDGVAGAQFTSELATVLGDIRHILL